MRKISIFSHGQVTPSNEFFMSTKKTSLFSISRKHWLKRYQLINVLLVKAMCRLLKYARLIIYYNPIIAETIF